MSKAHVPAKASTPWTLYLIVVGVVGFAAGIIFDQMVLHPPTVAQPMPSSPQQPQAPQANSGINGPVNPAMSANLSPAEQAITAGNAYYDQQNWTSAITEYQRAIAAGSDTPDVRTDLGNAYRFSGNPQKALEQYQIAQRQNPNHEQSLFNQGALYAQSLGDPITGAAKWREFIARFPSSPRAADARRLLAEFEAEFGKTEPAKP